MIFGMKPAKHWPAILLLPLALNGCGGGSLGGTQQSSNSRVTLVPSNVSGTVVLPAGCSLTLSSLQAATSGSTSPVDSSGKFTVTIYGSGPQLCQIMGPSQKPVLFGWIGGDRTTVNAHSTAEVLLYFGSGAFVHASKVRSWAMDAIAQRPEVAQIEQAVTTAMAANPDAVNSGTAAITTAVTTAVASLQASRAVKVDQSRSATVSASSTSRSVLIDPSDTRSGLTPVQDTLNSVKIINAYRRRGWAYFDRVSYVPSSGGASVPSPASVKDFEVPPTSGTSGLIGTFVDMMYGTMAYSQIATDPVSLPVFPADAKTTTYKLTVVGIGLYDGDIAGTTDAQKTKRAWMVGKSIVFDLMIPIILNCVLNDKGEEIDDFLKWANGSATLGDFINTLLVTVPGIWQKADSGDMRGAVWDAIMAVDTSATLKAAFLELLRAGFTNIGDANQFADYAQSFLNVLSLGDLILTSIDSGVQGAHIALCDKADVWTITVNSSHVKLTPAVSFVMSDSSETLHAALPDATGGGTPPVLAYRWSCTGNYGKLSDSLHSGTSFDSSSADVTFTPTSNTTGTDTVTVEVFEAPISQGKSYGTATATVTVQARSGAPILYPSKVSVFPGDTQTFTAKIDPASVGTGSLTYKWSTPGAFGALSQGVLQEETTSATMTYQARVGNEGTDTITVEAIVTSQGTRKSLGSATSTIYVQKRKIYYMASLSGEVERDPVNHFLGAWVFVEIPKQDGATSYYVHGYGFFDPLYYGSGFSFSGPPFPNTNVHPIVDTGTAYRVGMTSGGGSWDPHDPNQQTDDEILSSMLWRFSGSIWEVTASY